MKPTKKIAIMKVFKILPITFSPGWEFENISHRRRIDRLQDAGQLPFFRHAIQDGVCKSPRATGG
ncbi:hypothetical protein IMF27_27510 [Pseudomonas sp. PCH199]|uniref:hypothetical protein n=1 Tax=unclassified Pseudomonas TaxID=196821 RepID=UPI0015B018F8|nr:MULTISPECIES: hypothetical protein [unclassified Pseudomonas]MCW8278801.1 hypothetical protein [Pseudomonas sp. PCH199]